MNPAATPRRSRGPTTAAGLLPLALFFLAAAVAGGRLATAATLAEAIRTALATNPEVGVVAADREAVEHELRQARARYLPSVDLLGLVGPQYKEGPTIEGDPDETLFRSEAGLNLTQLLFDGFETRAEVDRQLARLDSAAYRVAEAAEFVALDAIEAYLNVLRNRRLVELAEDNVQAHERILGQVGQLQRQGAGNIADVRQTEARLAAARANLAQARQNLRDAAAAYTRAVGVPPEELVPTEPPAGAIPEAVEAAVLLAAAASPTVRIAEADVGVAEAELLAARSGYYPTFTAELEAQAGRNVEGIEERNLAASALIVMRYNLFRGGADVAREREAFARLREARRALDLARREAEEEAALSYSALQAARERVEALGLQAEANVRTRGAYADQFLLGQRGLLDLLDVENELFVSRSALATAEVTEDFGAYRLLTVTGLLLDELEIARPPEAVNIYRTGPEPLAEELPPEEGAPGDGAALAPAPATGVAAPTPLTGSAAAGRSPAGAPVPALRPAALAVAPAAFPADGSPPAPVPALRPAGLLRTADAPPGRAGRRRAGDGDRSAVDANAVAAALRAPLPLAPGPGVEIDVGPGGVGIDGG